MADSWSPARPRSDPWTPAAVQCDSYCQMRIRTFIEPLFVTGDDLEVQPFLGESIEAERGLHVWTIKVREGITFTDGTPLNADAGDRQPQPQRRRRARLGALKDLAKNPDRTLVTEKLDDYTFTHRHRQERRPNQPVSWPLFRTTSPAQAGFIASPAWLAAVDGDPDLATQPVGTGPFVVQEYLPG